MFGLAIVFLSVLVFPFLERRADRISVVLGGALSGDELRLALMIVGSLWLTTLLVIFSLGTELPGELFIYGRF